MIQKTKKRREENVFTLVYFIKLLAFDDQRSQFDVAAIAPNQMIQKKRAVATSPEQCFEALPCLKIHSALQFSLCNIMHYFLKAFLLFDILKLL